MPVSNKLLADINKTHGEGSVMKLSDGAIANIERIPTGSLELDLITGGGFPKGRIIEIFGPESSGKTTTAIQAIAEAQKLGGNCAVVDAEHAFDREYAKSLGVNVDELIISQPDSGEQALDIAKMLIASGEFSLILIDSTSALVPKSELEGDVGDAAMGAQARMLSKGLRMITGSANKNHCAVIFISQLREKIGVMYGDPRVIGVGNAMKFYASIRLEVKKSKPIEKNGVAIGHNMKFKTIKNKVFPPFKECETVLYYGKGYDRLSEVINLAVELQVMERKGAYYKYQGTTIGQGIENAREMLLDNPEVYEEIEAMVVEGLKQQ